MNAINLAMTGLVTLSVLPLTAIGGGQEIEACELLTRSEIAAALGRPVPEGLKDSGSAGEMKYSHCTYFKDKEAQFTTLLLTVWTYKSKAVVKQGFDAGIKEAGGDLERVNGLGDGAYWWKSKNTFFVAKDQYMVSILLGEEVAKLEAAKNIAGMVVKRLP
jgi:hypothetical protein